MMRPKQASKRKNQRRSMALPVLGAAGLSLAMTGNTSATVPATHLPFQGTGPGVNLGEEEISDVSLATFYVFDRENDAKPSQDFLLARRRRPRLRTWLWLRPRLWGLPRVRLRWRHLDWGLLRLRRRLRILLAMVPAFRPLDLGLLIAGYRGAKARRARG